MNAFLRNMILLSRRRQPTRDSRVIAVCVLITSIAVGAVTVPASATDDVDVRAVDALMQRLMSKYNVPGLALALIKDGRIVMEKGYGFRDLETRAPVTTETLFNIGSISKSFTALGIVQLVDQHTVNLDTPIIKYLPDLRLSDSQVRRTVTLRQLLSHTSGLPPDEQWPDRYRRLVMRSSVNSQRCRPRRNSEQSFNIVADAWCSQLMSLSA